jgi:hypothetical protein
VTGKNQLANLAMVRLAVLSSLAEADRGQGKRWRSA